MDKNKQQLVEKIKQSTNVLVTVSENPSVDQLAGAVGFTLLLNKLGKHATAVFSGEVPSTIEFLKPEQTLEKNTDSLRDFIIALNKDKADKLRYKVEDTHVRIFITPYKTSISEKDLEFSQGDFNVDMVIALGVHEQKHLDGAIKAHGRILHDAKIFAVNNQAGPDIGGVDVLDVKASSLCETLAGIGRLLKDDPFDARTATALLTGIVAETDRFRNEKTSATTMSISAALMKAGANQQLVASSLESELVVKKPVKDKTDEGTLELPKVEDFKDDEQPKDPSLLKIDNSKNFDEDKDDGNDDDADKPTPKPKDDDPKPPTNPKPATHLAELPIKKPEPTKPLPAEDSKDTDKRAYLNPSDEPDADDDNVLGQIHIDEHGEIKQKEDKDDENGQIMPKKIPEMKEHLIIEPPKHNESPIGKNLGSRLAGDDVPVPLVNPFQASAVSEPVAPAASSTPNSMNTSPVPTPPPQPTGLEAARAAVNQATDNAVDKPLAPIQALNAQPVDLNLGHDVDSASAPQPPAQSGNPDQYDVFPSSTLTPRPDNPGQPPQSLPANEGTPPPPPTGNTSPPPVPPPMMPPPPPPQ